MMPYLRRHFDATIIADIIAITLRPMMPDY